MGATGQDRIVSNHTLTPADFHDLAAASGRPVMKARKTALVAARQADAVERVETRWNGRETVNHAAPGDWIVVNLDAGKAPLLDADGHRNTYVVTQSRFQELYEPTGESMADGVICRGRTLVKILEVPAGFDIVAPWGERETGADGYLVLSGEEVYGIAKGAFEATYEVLPR